MFTHKWKLRLEMTTDDDSGPETTVIETTGSHDGNGSRPVNECVAINMAYICQMLLASGRIVSPSDMAETVAAFGDVFPALHDSSGASTVADGLDACVVKLEDGYQYLDTPKGALSAEDLRRIADELDARNSSAARDMERAIQAERNAAWIERQSQ